MAARKILFALFILAIIGLPNITATAAPETWRLQGWNKTNFEKTSIDLNEILSGGPPKDGIPSIDEPVFLPVGEEKSIAPREPVISLKIGETARAYPLRILTWHEIVNDVIGDVPVTVTYCPLCNAAIAFDRRVDGQILDFGTTGKLRKSDLIMYDRQTESWWQQFSGTAIVGDMTGTELKMLPVRLEAFERFAASNPNGEVLQPSPVHRRAYGMNPYAGYDTRSQPYEILFAGELPDYINPMERVVVSREGENEQAVSLTYWRTNQPVQLGDVVISWIAGQNSALDTRVIAEGRDIGNILAQRQTATGTVDVVHDVTFAFVFHAFHPDQRIRQN